jgi:hypothetical protein
MNTIEFHRTTNRELKAIQDRIRTLVPNWLEDGMYKEAVLKSAIRNFLPKNFDIASGYVIRKTGQRGNHEVSKQIDIIIYDNTYPVFFHKEELAIVTADSVRAIIEVKSSTNSENCTTTLRKSNEKGQFIFEGSQNQTIPLFNGIFYYNINDKTAKQIERYLKKDKLRKSSLKPVNKYTVDHIAFGENTFYKFWKGKITEKTRNYLYTTTELSFTFFISNLISYLQTETVAKNNFLWFPIDKNFDERETLWRF